MEKIDCFVDKNSMSIQIPDSPDTKYSSELRTYTWNFKRFQEIKSGDAIESIVSIESIPAGLTIDEETIAGDKVTANISGGTGSKTYEIPCTVLTTEEKQLTCLGRLYIPL